MSLLTETPKNENKKPALIVVKVVCPRCKTENVIWAYRKDIVFDFCKNCKRSVTVMVRDGEVVEVG